VNWVEQRATAVVMLGLAFAILTGYLREATLAYRLGAGQATDTFLVAFAVPEFITIALPIVLSAAFIPLLADLRANAGRAAAWQFSLRVSGALFVLLMILSLLLAASAPIYLPWLAPGFGAQQRSEAIRALYRMLPAIVLLGMANLVSAALQVYRRFARPALAAAANNLVFVATLLLLPLPWLVGQAAWGVTLGAGAALVLQLPLLWLHRPRRIIRPSQEDADYQPPTLRDFGRLAAPLTAGYAVQHAILFVDRAMASALGTGSVSAINYGFRLALVVGQLSGLAVSTALFPSFSEKAARREYAAFRTSLAAALHWVLVIALPASACLILLRVPIVQLLFERGAFDATATDAVSDVLRWYAVAVGADALCQPLWRAIYAMRRTRVVLVVNGVQTLIRLIGNSVLVPQFGCNGLALSAAAGLGVQLLLLGLVVTNQLGVFLTTTWWKRAFGTGAATACALLATALVHRQLSEASRGFDLLVSATAGAVVYLAMLAIHEKRRMA
jgi:putative peptidoglycan lipid II flippase